MGTTLTETVCVTGAAGYIGSRLVMHLLEKGYNVRATIQKMQDVSHLLELPSAEARLTVWEADLREEGSFDDTIKGCAGVFHLATPMDFESKDPEKEMIKPTIDGIVSIMKSCAKAKTVRRLVFTSSAGAVDGQEDQKHEYNENDWTDVEFCRAKKMTGWMYFISKTLAEQAAWEYAKEHNIDLITVLPTSVVGPFILPTFPPSFNTSLSLISRNESHYSIIKQGQFVHLDDLCQAHIHLFENPEAKGRYICSAYNATIYEIAKLLDNKYPEYNVPQKFENIDEKIEHVAFSSKKLTDTRFVFKYSLEDMFIGAIETCRAKGLLPMSFEIIENEVKVK